MNTDMANLLLLGALCTCAWVLATFFLRFWMSARERLFAFLSAAFGLLGLHWLSLAVVHWDTGTRHEPYLLRLLAFLLILCGIIDKNRRATHAADLGGTANDPSDPTS
jgi:uncharacterized membrane protein